MSYVELDNVIFRGNLKGAKGAAKFTLTADAIDAVDGINVKNGSISSYVIASSNSRVVVPGYANYLSVTLNGDDGGDLIDVFAYANSATDMVFRLNGSVMESRNKRYNIGNDLLMYRGFFRIKAGINKVQISNPKGSSVAVSNGILMAGYMRKTGLYLT